MISSAWICIVALLSLLSNAIPYDVPLTAPQRTFISESSGKRTSIKQIKNPKWAKTQTSTTDAYAAPFLKHHIPMPKNLSDAFQNRSSGLGADYTPSLKQRASGTTVSGSSGQFVFPVKIGTPSQTLYLIFDTGSGDLWVWSWQLPPSVLASHRSGGYYNASSSSTSTKFDGQSFNIAYVSGAVYGNVYLDTIFVESDDGSRIGVGGEPIECAQNVGPTFMSIPAVDGILGLNTWVKDQEQPRPQQTWLDYVLSPGHLAAQVFTVAFVRNGVGTMDFGFIDSTKYIGSIAYTPILQVPTAPATGYWSFYWSGFAIGSQAFNTSRFPVLTDTGGNMVLLPQSVIIKYYADVKGAYQLRDGSWCFPCSSTLPSFTFGVGVKKITVPPKVLIFSELGNDGQNCMGAIQSTPDTQYAYFGTPFMNSLFVIHDYANKRLGFAQRPNI